MKIVLLLLVGLFLLTPAAGDPYSELANLPAQTSIAIGFEVEPSLLFELFQDDREDLDRHDIIAVLWKQLKQQERLTGWGVLVGDGYVCELEIDDPDVLAERVQTFLALNSSWKSDGEGFQDYETRLEIDFDSSRVRFGDPSGMETIQTETVKLGTREAYQAFPVEKRSDRYVVYLQPNRFFVAPIGLREAVKDQPEKLAIIDKVFGQVPSYPDMAIVGTPNRSELVIWQDISLDGFTATNESVRAFHQEYNLPLSHAARAYFSFFVPPFPEMLKNLSSTSPRVTNADSFWFGVNEVFGG